jgi:hypothetical protein
VSLRNCRASAAANAGVTCGEVTRVSALPDARSPGGVITFVRVVERRLHEIAEEIGPSLRIL